MATSTTKTRVRRNKAPQKQSSSVSVFAAFVWLLLPIVLGTGYLGWKHWSTQDPGNSASHDPFVSHDQTIFEVVELPGKGKGIAAVRDIKGGELLIREKPLVYMPIEVPNDYFPGLLRSWPNTTYTKFLSLHQSNASPLSLSTAPADISDDELREFAVAVLEANGVAISGDRVALFPRMSRLNHACAGAFNAMYHWRADHLGSGEVFVYALKDIKKDEEITIFYMDTRIPRSERRHQLQESHNFTCTCPVCSLPDDLSLESDERLARMVSLYAEFSTYQPTPEEGEETISAAHAITLARQLWDLQDRQGYFHERGKFAEEVAAVAASASDEAAIKEWGRLAEIWYGIELGTDHFESRGVGCRRWRRRVG